MQHIRANIFLFDIKTVVKPYSFFYLKYVLMAIQDIIYNMTEITDYKGVI